MKKLTAFVFLLSSMLSFPTFAGKVTLTGPEEVVSGDTKICVYEGHGTTKTYEVDDTENCPFAKTFDTDE